MKKRAFFLLLALVGSAQAQTSKPTLAECLLVPSVAHVVLKAGGCDAYKVGELASLPSHAKLPSADQTALPGKTLEERVKALESKTAGMP